MRLLAPATVIVLAFALLAASGGGLETRFEAALSGDQEVATPPVVTDLSGRIRLRFDPALGALDFDVRLSPPENQLLAGHLHCGPAGTNGPVVVDLLGQFGPFEVLGGGQLALSGTITNDHVTPTTPGAVCPIDVNNVASLLHAIREGVLYANFHSDAFVGGETRGQIFTRR
jgi:hypothetical protein